MNEPEKHTFTDWIRIIQKGEFNKPKTVTFKEDGITYTVVKNPLLYGTLPQESNLTKFLKEKGLK